MMPRIGKEQEIENEFFEHEQDENDTADEYMITYVTECNTNDEPVLKPAILYPTYDLPDDWMAKEIQKMRVQANEKKLISDLKMIEEPQPLQKMIQNDKGCSKYACSDGTEFEDT